MCALSFPARFEYLDQIRDYVGKQARLAGFNDKDVYSVQLATDEAASNIIEHAYVGIPDGFIELTCELKGDRIIVTLLDHGKSFDPSKVAQPNVKADLSKRKIGGLGIYLMHKLMDEVHYQSTAGGNLLTLVKRKG